MRKGVVLALAWIVGAGGAGPAVAGEVIHTVRSGDSLSLIALRTYGEASAWPVLYEANRRRLDDPDVIHVGDRLVIPDVDRGEIARGGEDRGTVRLVTGDAYPPYAGRDLPRGGMATDIVTRVFERAGYRVELTRAAWSEGYAATVAGELAGTFPYMAGEARVDDFDGFVSEPLTAVLVRLFTRAADNFRYTGDADLDGMVACRPRGYFTHDLAPLVDAGVIDLLRTPGVADCFERLAEGRVDFVAVNRFTAAAAIEAADLDPRDFRMARRPFHRDRLHLLISPRTERPRELLSDFNEALAEMAMRGELHNLRIEHFVRYRRENRSGPWTAEFGMRDPAPTAEPQEPRTDTPASEPSPSVDAAEDAAGEDAESGTADTDATDAGDDAREAADADPAVEPDLRLVSGPAYAPFAGPGLPRRGMTTEIVERVAEEAGWTIAVDFEDWERAREAAAAGDFAATYPWVKTDFRHRDFVFSDPLYSMPVMIFTRAGADLEFNALNDLRGTVACKAAGYYRSDIKELVAAGFTDLVEAPTLAACFERVAAGEADFVTVNRYTGWQTIDGLEALGREDFTMLGQAIAEVDLHLMVPRSTRTPQTRVNAFDRRLEKLRASGELQAIQERHLENHMAQ